VSTVFIATEAPYWT